MANITFYIKDELKQALETLDRQRVGEKDHNWAGIARAAFEDTVLADATPATRARFLTPSPTRVSAARHEFLRGLERSPLILTRAERAMIRVALRFYLQEHPAGEATENDLRFLMDMVADPRVGNTVDFDELRKQNDDRSMHKMLLESQHHQPMKG